MQHLTPRHHERCTRGGIAQGHAQDEKSLRPALSLIYYPHTSCHHGSRHGNFMALACPFACPLACPLSARMPLAWHSHGSSPLAARMPLACHSHAPPCTFTKHSASENRMHHTRVHKSTMHIHPQCLMDNTREYAQRFVNMHAISCYICMQVNCILLSTVHLSTPFAPFAPPYHTIPYHTIPYHTIPYHALRWAIGESPHHEIIETNCTLQIICESCS